MNRVLLRSAGKRGGKSASVRAASEQTGLCSLKAARSVSSCPGSSRRFCPCGGCVSPHSPALAADGSPPQPQLHLPRTDSSGGNAQTFCTFLQILVRLALLLRRRRLPAPMARAALKGHVLPEVILFLLLRGLPRPPTHTRAWTWRQRPPLLAAAVSLCRKQKCCAARSGTQQAQDWA